MRLPKVHCDAQDDGYLCAAGSSYFYAIRSKGTSPEAAKVLLYGARCVRHPRSEDSKLFAHQEISHAEYIAAQVHEA